MMPEIATAIASVKHAADLAKIAAQIKTDSATAEKVIELQAVILSLQAQLMLIQTTAQKLSDEKRDLEQQIVESKNWDNERPAYEIKPVGRGLVYAKKSAQETGVEQVWLCVNCFEQKKKSILQASPPLDEFSYYICPQCKTKVFTG